MSVKKDSAEMDDAEKANLVLNYNDTFDTMFITLTDTLFIPESFCAFHFSLVGCTLNYLNLFLAKCVLSTACFWLLFIFSVRALRFNLGSTNGDSCK